MRLLNRLIPFSLLLYVRVVYRKPDGKVPGVGIHNGRTNMRFSYPETGGISQSRRAVGKPRNLHKPKNTPGLGSNPGFPIVRRPRFHGATARPISSLL